MPETVQDKGLVFALDIGTRSIVGVLGREEGGRFHVLDIEKEEHGRRAMLDGQIEDIAQVAAIANTVIERLQARQQIRLRKVCVAAAGRALKSAKASFTLEFTDARQADDETVNQLEAGAVSAAESVVSDGVGGTFYMVGYTASQYRLDGYPMSTLHGHRGKVMEADVVATFLPREVVDSLYTVVARLGLEVSSLTLEPIASLNAAIPVDIRLLNLVLVDIGAGTSDIAVCRDGSVSGYTMATVAGDEVTELLMRKLLIDFRTGEALKMGIGGKEPLKYVDILGIPHECSSEMLVELIEPAVQLLAGEIAGKVLELNGAPPSAVFLAGGGSKLHGLRQAVASALGMDDARVAIAGNHFERNAFSEGFDLNDPEYSTPLGIAVSAALGMINDSYVVTLNGVPAKLFRSGTLSVRDILLMNGCRYGDMIGRTGANLIYTLNGTRQFVRGTHGTPPVIHLNGAAAELSDLVHAGDNVDFTPAKAGSNAMRTLGEALGEGFTGGVTVNGAAQPLSYRICTGDAIETGSGLPEPLPEDESAKPVQREEKPPSAEPKVLRSHAVVLSNEPPAPEKKTNAGSQPGEEAKASEPPAPEKKANAGSPPGEEAEASEPPEQEKKANAGSQPTEEAKASEPPAPEKKANAGSQPGEEAEASEPPVPEMKANAGSQPGEEAEASEPPEQEKKANVGSQPRREAEASAVSAAEAIKREPPHPTERTQESAAHPTERTAELESAAYSTERTAKRESAAYSTERTAEPESATYPTERTAEPESAAYPAERTAEPESAAYSTERTAEPESAAYPTERMAEPESVAHPAERTAEPESAAYPTERTAKRESAAYSLRQELRNEVSAEAALPLDGQLEFDGIAPDEVEPREEPPQAVPLTAAQREAFAAAQAISQAAAAAVQGMSRSEERPPVPSPAQSAALAEAQRISMAAAAAMQSAAETTPARYVPNAPAQAGPAAVRERGDEDAGTVPQAAEPRQESPVRPEPKRRGIPHVILPDLPVFQTRVPQSRRTLHIRMNGEPLVLEPKENGDPYYFMDILQYSGLDFNRLERPVEMLLNGMHCEFTQKLAENDDVVVRYQD